MTDELKPCPFCGDSGVTMNEGSTFRWCYLSCNSCGATPGEVRVQTFGDGTPDEWEKQAAKDAIAAWNRRALKAEETCRQLTSALGDEVNGPTFMGEPVLPAAAPDGEVVVTTRPDGTCVAVTRQDAEGRILSVIWQADAAPSVAPEPPSEQKPYGDLRNAKWLDPACYAHGACQSLVFKAAHPPRAPLTEEIESADNLLRHLGLDPERCRTEGGSLNVSRIKTLLADAAPTARESAMEELLRSAAAIAQRHGAGTAWDRFGASIKALGIGAITARTYRLLPSDTERQQPPTTDPSRLADDLSNIGTMSPRIRKLYDDAAAFIRSTQAPLAPWQSMKTAPKDGAAVLVLLDASDIPHAARWLSGPDDRRATEETTRAGWHLTWDGSPIEEHDGPRYWMHCPDDPDESDIEAAHGIGGK